VEVLKKLRKNRLFIIGLLIPIIFQIVYLCIAIPAIKDGNTRIKDLTIAIVNEDNTLGKQVSAQLIQVLPFKIEEISDFDSALDSMSNGDLNMVLHIASDFTLKSQQGGAQVSYYINQSAPSMTKQAMEKTAISINQTLNENSFINIKDNVKQNVAKSLSQSGLPENVVTQMSNNLSNSLDKLKYTTINSDILKVNNADGFAQTALPFFIFLTYFVGCIIMTILHSQVYKSLSKEVSSVTLLVSQLVISIAFSLVIPCVVIGLAAAFDIPFSLEIFTTWMLLSVGFFTLLYTTQLFANWFGITGMGMAILILFPLQLVTSGLIYSKEILPSFYSAISNYLPASYFGDGMFKIFYGGATLFKDVWILLLMSLILIILSALTVFKKERAVRIVGEKVQA
jgi:uncharacterized phage infection (PIP) family protein YhgE